MITEVWETLLQIIVDDYFNDVAGVAGYLLGCETAPLPKNGPVVHGDGDGLDSSFFGSKCRWR